MPLQKPLPPSPISQEKKEQKSTSLHISEVLNNDAEDVDYPEMGKKAMAILTALFKGEITLDGVQIACLNTIIRKCVPDAPRLVVEENTIEPEEYLAAALKNNEGAFERIKQRAKEFTKLEMEKTTLLYETFYKMPEEQAPTTESNKSVLEDIEQALHKKAINGATNIQMEA